MQISCIYSLEGYFYMISNFYFDKIEFKFSFNNYFYVRGCLKIHIILSKQFLNITQILFSVSSSGGLVGSDDKNIFRLGWAWAPKKRAQTISSAKSLICMIVYFWIKIYPNKPRDAAQPLLAMYTRHAMHSLVCFCKRNFEFVAFCIFKWKFC